jgi:hypothetical protein
MDWCDKYPCYQNAKANPEGVDRQYGRIWRVVTTQSSSVVPASAGSENVPPKGGTTKHASRPSNDLDLKKLSTADLVKTLEHPNNWMRRIARRLLVEKQDPQATTQLIVQAANAVEMDSFWTLGQFGGILGSEVTNGKVERGPVHYVWIARFIGDYLAAKHSERSENAADKKLAVWASEALKRIAGVNDAQIQAAVCIAIRQSLTGNLTTTTPKLSQVCANDALDVASLVTVGSSRQKPDQYLGFACWSASSSPKSAPEHFCRSLNNY